MKDTIERLIGEGLKEVGAAGARFVVEHPVNLDFGDYSTNAGIVSRKASELLAWLAEHKPAEVEKVELKAGFINFYLSKKFFADSLREIVKKGDKFGRSDKLKGEKVMVEYTDPNPFKEFHIGHLMSNAIGEAISRLIEWGGAEVKRANYQGDVGLHVAMALWKGDYPLGAKAYNEDPKAKLEIEEINRRLYEGTDKELNRRYEEGKKESLEKFEKMYKKLGTKFDYYFFESETASLGKRIVEENMQSLPAGRQVFEESDGAVVFHAEKFDPSLHTRVFINSQGLPTYEAKDLGNAVNKYRKYKYTESIVVTGNEIKDYFRVVLAALGQIEPALAERTKHLPHGMLRLPSGKMSSRTGEVITAESLIEEVKERTKGNEEVSIGAIKYMILRQAIGNDIIFDISKSVSTEGDSGVYLEYAHARACSILEKGTTKSRVPESNEVRIVERLLYRFPEVVERAGAEFAPQYVATYLTELASAFNNFYAHEQVIGSAEEAYLLNIVQAFKIVMRNGLDILAIPAPERV